eukprot:COSAG04_NODE_367_length_15823_cov_6.139977_9_plen_260_part_00
MPGAEAAEAALSSGLLANDALSRRVSPQREGASDDALASEPEPESQQPPSIPSAGRVSFAQTDGESVSPSFLSAAAAQSPLDARQMEERGGGASGSPPGYAASNAETNLDMPAGLQEAEQLCDRVPNWVSNVSMSALCLIDWAHVVLTIINMWLLGWDSAAKMEHMDDDVKQGLILRAQLCLGLYVFKVVTHIMWVISKCGCQSTSKKQRLEESYRENDASTRWRDNQEWFVVRSRLPACPPAAMPHTIQHQGAPRYRR